MVQTCSVFGCRERAGKNSRYKFHSFPQVRKGGINLVISEIRLRRRLAWYQALKRSDLKESDLKSRRICSKHFVSGVPARDTDESSPDWIPLIHMGHQNSISPGTAEVKYAKWKRCQDRKTRCSTSFLKPKRDHEQSSSDVLKMTQENEEIISLDEPQNIAESEPVSNQDIEQVVDSMSSEKTDDSHTSFPADHPISPETDVPNSTSKSSEAQTDFTWEGIELSAILSDLHERTEENCQLREELSEKDERLSQLTSHESAFFNNDKMKYVKISKNVILGNCLL